MPFESSFPRDFSASAVRAYAPAQSGVYGISNSAEWLLIGETDNLQATLLELLRTPPAGSAHRPPTGFVFELCDQAKRPARQEVLSREFVTASAGRASRQR